MRVELFSSHKANTAIAQAYYNKKEGIKRITTEPVPVNGEAQ